METVLVVVAHPDDEVLGCGGTMAKHGANGDKVHTLILADGFSARLEGASRHTNALRAAETLGGEPPQFLDLPDNRLDTLPLLNVVKLVEGVVETLKPTIVYTHHGGDLNVDHRITHQAVMTACRPLPGSSVTAIYSFEVASSTELSLSQTFQPTHFVDIDLYLETKLDALACYEDEMRCFPHSRSLRAVEALAHWRGASVGVEAAESFEILRQIA
jgi:LmbE family N-acetylglucosaminyl deacetylase|tara:strand:+ start:98 stop:745 length:648 start_codon:yes stop_codon:yes gene_type:complete